MGSDRNTPLETALRALTERGVLDAEQAGAVAAEYAAQAAGKEGLRGRLGEIAGYLGASLVLGAAVLFLGERWEQLGTGGRTGALAVVALVLAVAGVVVRVRNRRLASTLFAGGALTAGWATHACFAEGVATFGVMLVLAVAGYAAARGAVGLLTAAGAACGLYGYALDAAGVEWDGALGAGLVVLGLVWAALAYRMGSRVALVIAVVLGVAGAQLTMLGDDNWLAYALTALVAGACFAAYLRGRDWIALAGGVVGATLVVPEFLYDVTDGSLGAAGAMLVAGVTLLVAGLAALRLRRAGRAEPTAG